MHPSGTAPDKYWKVLQNCKTENRRKANDLNKVTVAFVMIIREETLLVIAGSLDSLFPGKQQRLWVDLVISPNKLASVFSLAFHGDTVLFIRYPWNRGCRCGSDFQ